MCADSATLAGSAGNHLPHERDHLLWAGRVRLLWEVDRYLVEVEKITPRRSNSPGSEIAPFIRPNLTGLRRTIGEKKRPCPRTVGWGRHLGEKYKVYRIPPVAT
jgi:hypothetical protein